MTTGKALNGKPYAGNPHVRFDEGEVASAATPRRGSLLYNANKLITLAAVAASVAMPLAANADSVTWTGAADSNPLNANNWTNSAEEAVLPGTTDTALIGDAPEANLSNGSATYLHLKLGTENGKTGTLTVGNGGTLTATEKTGGALSMGNVDGSSAVLNIDGGSVILESLNTPNYAATSTINLIDGTLTINEWADWGRNANGRAEFNQSGGTLDLTKGFQIGRDNNGTGIYTMSGGTLNGSSGDYFMVGRLGTSTGTFNLIDGTVNFGSKDVTIGGHDNNAGSKATKGYFNQSGGTVSAAGNMQIGRYGTGVYTQTGGNLTCKASFSIGRFSSGKGTYTITGGTFSAPNKDIIVGEEGSGTLNIGGTATVNLAYNMNLGTKDSSAGAVIQNGGIVTLKDVRAGNVAGATGTYTLNAGTNRTTTGWIQVGPAGTGKFIQNGGELQIGANKRLWLADTETGDGTYVINGGLCTVGSQVGVGVKGKGFFMMDGGMFNAQQIKSGVNAGGSGRVLLNGGTFRPNVAGSILANGSGTADWTLGRDFTIDTDGKDVSSAVSLAAASGSALTKDGEGKLTLAALPLADSVTIAKGTLALSSGGDNTKSIVLAHRWSFNGDANDSVGKADGALVGSAAYTNDNTAVSLPGGSNGTGYVNLGKGIFAGDNLTLEFWAKRVEYQKWARIFECGTDQSNYLMASWVYGTNARSDKLAVRYGNDEKRDAEKMAFTDDEMVHLAIRFVKNENGSTTITWVRRSVDGTGTVVKTSDFTPTGLDAGWALEKVATGDFFLGHSSVWTADSDANAVYDEVRVWHGALSDDALTLSAQKGADATAEDIAAIIAKNDETVTVGRAVEIASGATLDLGGNTLTQPVVKGSGTIATGVGSLVVSDKLVVNVGECIKASGTIDLSNAKLELADPANLASPFTFLKPVDGQTLAIVGVPTPKNLPKGWKVSVSADGTGRIVKRGLMLIVR